MKVGEAIEGGHQRDHLLETIIEQVVMSGTCAKVLAIVVQELKQFDKQDIKRLASLNRCLRVASDFTTTICSTFE